MENSRLYCASKSQCLQAVYHAEHNWKWIGQPARLEYLAKPEVFLHFKAHNTTSSSDLATSNNHQRE
jgi:hypothetical protein